jgi:N4-gp56 family major capsid protein
MLKRYLINLQLFAAGTTEITNVQLTSQTTSGSDMSPALRMAYSASMLDNAREAQVFLRFGMNPESIHGNTIKWQKFNTFEYKPEDVTLSEGVIPDGRNFGMTEVTGTVNQYGAYTPISDRLAAESFVKIVAGCTEEHGAASTEVYETVVRDVLCAAPLKYYAPKTVNSVLTPVLLRKDLDATSKLTMDVIKKSKTWLDKNKAGTKKISGNYVAIIHPSCAYDLTSSTAWNEAHKYSSPGEIFRGEIGTIDGVSFIVSNRAKVIAPAVISNSLNRLYAATASTSSTTLYVDEELTAATPSPAINVYIGGTANTITKIEADETYGSKLTLGTAQSVAEGDVVCGTGACADGSDVYENLIFAADVWGKINPDGEGHEMIIKSKGEVGGPLEQFGTVGWKGTMGAKILYPERMIRVECSSSMGFEDEEN